MVANFSMGKWQVFPDDCHVSNDQKRIKLEPKAMALLIVLAKADGQLVSREDIFSAVWKNQLIADHVLYNLIACLRKILEDDPQQPQYIITVPKKGYKLGQQMQQPETKTNKHNWQTLVKIFSGFIVFAIIAFTLNKMTNENSVAIAKTVVQPSIAVLPFDVYDSEPNLSYFADGLSEEIIHQLTAIPELSVVSRTSSFSFREKKLDIKTIAQKLNSQFILEGSVRKSGNLLRVTIQLIKAKTGTHLWSKVFNFSENDVLRLQQEISLSVVGSMLPDYGGITSGRLRVHPQHGEAYMHYLRGSAMAAKATVEEIQKAIKEFEMAIELQPNYSLAHVSIALNTMVLYQHRVIASEEAHGIAQYSIDRALDVDPFLALAHTAQGLLYINYGEYDKAEESFKTALNLDPVLPLAHHNYGYFLWLQDKHEQALDHFQIALARNPMSAITNFAVADSLFVTGQLNDALKQYKHCIVLLPDYPACTLGISNFYRFTSQPQKAQHYMSVAKQQLADDNIYWITAKAIDEFWQGNVEAADNMQNKIADFTNGGYLQLQLKMFINIKMGKFDEWLLTLESLSQKWPENKSVTLNLALNYYFVGNCSKSLVLYESALLEDIELHGKFNIVAWGVSHLTNMADCYQQTDNQLGHQKMMQLLTQQMEKFQTDNHVIPGLMLVKAKIDLLSGKPVKAKSTLESFNTLSSPLKWIVTVDPMFLSFR
jgi:TolB-like protein/DNA-binding winged helix-turn-helix (wHTH) protein/Tfp pilus assembly protein PilF